MKKWLFGWIITMIFPLVVFAGSSLDQVNQRVCDRFEEDTSKLAAIMEQLRERKGITGTRMAFGGSDTLIKSADYYINFAAEAIAFQRVQKFSSDTQLKYSLQTLKGKILTAKNAVGKALDSNEQK